MKTLMEMRGSKLDGSVCLELESDMKTVKGGEHPIVPGYDLARKTEFDGHAFFEASSIRKVDGRYFYVYSSILSHELCYAYSDYPDRDFHFGGTLISIGDIGYKGNTKPLNWLGNTHGGMAEINGQWYIFYHRQTNRLKCNRQGCAEKLTFRADGTIEQAEVTSCGLNGGPLNAKGVFEARIACNLNGKDGIISSDGARKKDKKMLYPYFTQSGKDREGNSDQYIANLKRDSWAGFKYFVFDGTETRIKVTVRSSTGAILAVHTDLNKTPAALISIEPCTDWKEFSADLKPYTGETPLYFIVRTDSCVDFRSFEIE